MIRFMGLKAEELSKSQDTTLKMMPDSFGSDDAAGEDNVGSKGTGTSMKVGNKSHDNGKEGKGIGNRLATQRQSYNTAKKSFWD